MKKAIILITIFCVIIFNISFRTSASTIDSRDLLRERNFLTNSIIVISDNSIGYDVNDFNDIKAKRIKHLSNRLETKTVKEKNVSSEQIYEINFEGKDKNDVLDVIDIISKRKDIIYVGPNYIYDTYYAIPNDPYFSLNSSAYSLVSLQSAWDISTGSSNVKVGIIDSGINPHYTDLIAHYDHSLSQTFSEDGITANIDNLGHGTSVASVLGATNNNSHGTTGICWDLKIVSLKVANADGTFTTASVASAINYANNNSIPIINMSIGFHYDLAIKTAIDNYYGLVVCAAGNEGRNIDSFYSCYPASFDCDNILSVGSCSNYDTISGFSNVSAEHVDVFAPGENIAAVYPCMGCQSDNHISQNLHKCSGTSYSSPFVAGIAALLLSKYPYLSANDIKNTIVNNVDESQNYSYLCTSGGRVNAYKALMNPYHSHSYTIYEWRSTTQHLESCACGGASRLRGHVLVNGQSRCILCKGNANAGIVQPTVLDDEINEIAN